MNTCKKEILSKICYTDLVYGRINKKLNLKLSNMEIEKTLLEIIQNTEEINFEKRGKNIYISNESEDIRITINLFTNRVITVDRIKQK
ncbi:DUF3781 domain-containing protein [Kaistella jeonii]|uniref:DUF3781 domain-containing protein n=1 Tax=Kaistella jeonii TaxID=266749 RepID=A0A0C1D2T5_9FLAO|nr:DUF3781 domain-containing protein [Kaistella jeonii]KIA88090.1 hypothetical protein OA86_12905 [Kaistella jeonii]SFC32051.1 Protein of unknown function [Kaistella jeonii]VEI95636.1 Protein of uncharacterised function (DUF3781) [Kaistella jeonii]